MSLARPRAIGVIAASLFAFGLAPIASHAERANRGSPDLSYHGQSIDQMIASFMKEKHVDGITLAIVQAPYIPRVAGYGKTNSAKGLLASSNTLWNIGPITQGYTAVAVMQLVEQGKMRVDAPIAAYVPDLPAAWRKVTVKQLLQHASGIADYRRAAGFDASHDVTPQQLIDNVRDQPLAFHPGTLVAQSATNFLLLGLAIEHASGLSYHDMIWLGQIKPLGLRQTLFAEDFPAHTQQDPVERNGNFHSRFLDDAAYVNPTEPATGYAPKGDTEAPVARNASSSLFAYGSLWASAEDVSIWDIGLAGNLLLKAKADRDFIYAPTTLDNGRVVPAMAGWQFTGHKGFMDIKGSVPGYSAYLSRFTDRDELVCVTLLSNKEGVDMTDLARRIASAYDATLGSDVDPAQQNTYESAYGVDETVQRLERNIKAMGGKVFASLDQTAAGAAAGMSLRPTHLIVFGDPRIGTRLMQDSVAAAADLPLHVAVWKDARNQTWIGYDNAERMAERDGLKDRALLTQMENGVAEIVRKSASVY